MIEKPDQAAAWYREGVRRRLLVVGELNIFALVALLAFLLSLPYIIAPIFDAIGRVLPLSFFGSSQDYYLRVMDQAGIYVLLALGLNIVVGYAGLLDLGYVAFYAVGAYSYALLASPVHGIHLPFPVILVIAVVLAMVCGALLGAPTLRLRGDYLAIVTLGFGEIIRIFLVNFDTLTEGPSGITNIDHPWLVGVELVSAQDYYYLILAMCVIAVVFASRLQESRIGRAWAAIREDEDAARATGVKIVRLKLMAYVMGACTAGFAGCVFAGLQGFVSPESFVLTESVLVLSMLILGGMGHIPGVIVGAILLVVLPEVMREFQQDRLEVFGLGLVIMMLIRPEGIWPSRLRRLELHEGPQASIELEGPIERAAS